MFATHKFIVRARHQSDNLALLIKNMNSPPTPNYGGEICLKVPQVPPGLGVTGAGDLGGFC